MFFIVLLPTVIGHDPGKMAAVVAKAVCGFVAEQADQKVVQEIRIVIFQKTMLDPVINGFKSSIQGNISVSFLSVFQFLCPRIDRAGHIVFGLSICLYAKTFTLAIV